MKHMGSAHPEGANSASEMVKLQRQPLSRVVAARPFGVALWCTQSVPGVTRSEIVRWARKEYLRSA
jgi:hypothetical protein